MRTYARIQKFCFYGGVIGLVIMLALLLFNSNADFVGAFNSQAQDVYGAGGDAYQRTLDAGSVGNQSRGSRLRPDVAPDPDDRLLQPVV